MGSKGPERGKITTGGKSADLHNMRPRPSRRDDLAAAVLEQVTAETPHDRRSRKDTRRWCKGKPGREHQPRQVTISAGMGLSCGAWFCWHAETCACCGKILRYLKPAECPAAQAA